jgi:hypothetical protein
MAEHRCCALCATPRRGRALCATLEYAASLVLQRSRRPQRPQASSLIRTPERRQPSLVAPSTSTDDRECVRPHDNGPDPRRNGSLSPHVAIEAIESKYAQVGGEGGIRSRRSPLHQRFSPIGSSESGLLHSKPEYQVQNRYSTRRLRRPSGLSLHRGHATDFRLVRGREQHVDIEPEVRSRRLPASQVASPRTSRERPRNYTRGERTAD